MRLSRKRSSIFNRLFINPVVLGGGTPYFPSLPKPLDLELIGTQAFSQVVYLRYRRN